MRPGGERARSHASRACRARLRWGVSPHQPALMRRTVCLPWVSGACDAGVRYGPWSGLSPWSSALAHACRRAPRQGPVEKESAATHAAVAQPVRVSSGGRSPRHRVRAVDDAGPTTCAPRHRPRIAGSRRLFPDCQQPLRPFPLCLALTGKEGPADHGDSISEEAHHGRFRLVRAPG